MTMKRLLITYQIVDEHYNVVPGLDRSNSVSAELNGKKLGHEFEISALVAIRFALLRLMHAYDTCDRFTQFPDRLETRSELLSVSIDNNSRRLVVEESQPSAPRLRIDIAKECDHAGLVAGTQWRRPLFSGRQRLYWRLRSRMYGFGCRMRRAVLRQPSCD